MGSGHGKTVLFDLDGTLLPVDLEIFTEQYVKAVSSWFSGMIEPGVFRRALLAATYAMITNDDPDVTNEEAFRVVFETMVGYEWDRIWPVFDNFYRMGFPGLKTMVPETTVSRQVVGQCVDDGWQIVLATNPIFPEIAVRERMKWCEIDDFPWKYITTLENSRFCKPKVEYYRDICEIARLDPRKCVMVGNDRRDDMIAKKLGMKTYLVEDFLIDNGEGEHPDLRGSLAEVPRKLEILFFR